MKIKKNILFWVFTILISNLFSQNGCYNSDSIKLIGRNITMYPTKNLKFKVVDYSNGGRNVHIQNNNDKFYLSFIDYGAHYSTFKSKVNGIEKYFCSTIFKESKLYSLLNKNIRDRVVYFYRNKTPLFYGDELHIETPTGQVLIFYSHSYGKFKLMPNKGNELFAEFLNKIKFDEFILTPKENTKINNLTALPKTNHSSLNQNDKYSAISYLSETDRLLIDVFDNSVKSKVKTFDFTDKLMDITSLSIKGDTLAMICLNNFELEENLNSTSYSYLPYMSKSNKPKSEVRLYSISTGKELKRYTLTEEIVIKNVGEKGYGRSGNSSITLTENYIIVSIPVNGKFDDGLIHQGEKQTILDYNGNEIYNSNWTVSHSFQQYTLNSNDFNYFISVGDGHPRAINVVKRKGGEFISRYSFFDFPGELGDNYVFDTKINEVFEYQKNLYLIFESELYKGFNGEKKYSNKYHFSNNTGHGGKGPNQIFLNIGNDSTNSTIQLTNNNKIDYHLLASHQLSNGNIVLAILEYKKGESSSVDLNNLKKNQLVKYKDLSYKQARADLDSLFNFNEFLMVVDKNGKVLDERIEFEHNQKYFWTEDVSWSSGKSYKSKFINSNDDLILFRQIFPTNKVEFISFSKKMFNN